MTASTSTIARLRDASSALAPERVATALERSAALWRAPGSRWRERLARDLPRFSPAAFERGIPAALESWSFERLRSLQERNLGPYTRSPEVTLVWLASSVPTAAWAAVALPLLARSAVLVRPGPDELPSVRLFVESLAAVDPDVAAAVHATELAHDDFAGAAAASDAVVVHGRDDTVRALRDRVPVDRPFSGHGHRLSVALVGARADLGVAAAEAAFDVALWDGRGCLSPAFVLADDRPAGRAREVAERLAERLAELGQKLPRGALDPAEHVALRELRAHLCMLDGATPFLSRSGPDSGVVLVRFAARAPTPPPGWLRNVAVVAVTGLEGISAFCAALAPALSTLGHADTGASERALADAVARGSGSRVCPLGQMQLPPIDWHHDGRDPLGSLLRVVDVEPWGG